MERYGKTYGPFKRDTKTGAVIHGKWTHPVFDYLKDARWRFTEKLDGTNMRLIYTPPLMSHSEMGSFKHMGSCVSLKGRSDAADVHGTLAEWAKDITAKRFETALHELAFYAAEPVCIYGEGIGEGIQKGGTNYGPTHFRAFAVKSRGVFWEPRYAEALIRHKLGIPMAPVILEATLLEGIEYMKKGFRTCITGEEQGYAEGLIGVPTVPLTTPQLDRIVVKIKACDFQESE